MAAEESSDLSGVKDVKRYDRQIRLWGADTQRGLQSARILVIGANGLANEVCKNLVLAGIAHCTVQDAGILSEADLIESALFSVASEHKGTSRAQALVEQLREMNPTVELEARQASVATLDADFLRSFHFVICAARGAGALRDAAVCTALVEGRGGADATTGEPPDEPPAKRHRANGDSGPPLARSNGAHLVVPLRVSDGGPAPRILAAGTVGLEGYCFFDLGEAHAKVQPPKKADANPDADGKTAPPAAPPVLERALYPTVTSACQVEWAALTKRVPRVYHALQLLAHASSASAAAAAAAAATPLADATSLLPAGTPKGTVELLQVMLTRRAELLHGTSDVGKAATPEYLAEVAQSVGLELAPVCAVLGGMIASEVVKIIGGKERPIHNALFFDGVSADGVVQRLGPSFDCPWGLDKGEFKALAPLES